MNFLFQVLYFSILEIPFFFFFRVSMSFLKLSFLQALYSSFPIDSILFVSFIYFYYLFIFIRVIFKLLSANSNIWLSLDLFLLTAFLSFFPCLNHILLLFFTYLVIFVWQNTKTRKYITEILGVFLSYKEYWIWF